MLIQTKPPNNKIPRVCQWSRDQKQDSRVGRRGDEAVCPRAVGHPSSLREEELRRERGRSDLRVREQS